MATKGFDFAAGSTIDLHFANVSANLHAVGARVHAQSTADGARNTDQTFHAAEVVLGAEGDSAAEVGGGIDASKIAVQNDAGIRWCELQDDPGKVAVAHEQIRATSEEFMGNLVCVQKTEQIRN